MHCATPTMYNLTSQYFTGFYLLNQNFQFSYKAYTSECIEHTSKKCFYSHQDSKRSRQNCVFTHLSEKTIKWDSHVLSSTIYLPLWCGCDKISMFFFLFLPRCLSSPITWSESREIKETLSSTQHCILIQMIRNNKVSGEICSHLNNNEFWREVGKKYNRQLLRWNHIVLLFYDHLPSENPQKKVSMHKIKSKSNINKMNLF